MNATKLIAAALIIAGGLGLTYGGFTYTRQTQQAQIGPLELTVKDQQTVGIPVWAGAAAIAAGLLLLLIPKNA